MTFSAERIQAHAFGLTARAIRVPAEHARASAVIVRPRFVGVLFADPTVVAVAGHGKSVANFER